MAENGIDVYRDIFQLEPGFSETRMRRNHAIEVGSGAVDVTLERNREAQRRAAAARDTEEVAKRKLQEFTADTQTAVIGSLKQRVNQLEDDLIGKGRELLQSESRREELATERSLLAGHYVATAESKSAHAVSQLTVVRDENCALLAQFSDMERLLHVKDREIWSRDEEKHVLEEEVVELKRVNHSKDVDVLLLQDEVRTLQSQLSTERTRHAQEAREAASNFESRIAHLETVYEQSVDRSKAALDALQVELDHSRSIQGELREQISRQRETIEAQLQSERSLRLEVVQLQQSLHAADAVSTLPESHPDSKSRGARKSSGRADCGERSVEVRAGISHPCQGRSGEFRGSELTAVQPSLPL
ncbi:MAG: uncharacterized protein KVP18_002935 [Porospora cf. gigantea A]|uniref:uncharacterized protein n=1 Tax=Porospora cf. gigantea A TaxID=2853593 RepID=UPI00355A3DDD|nr:MAG: hypothetical protein KVP18_002935 [Porospora cf. gigantea A]